MERTICNLCQESEYIELYTIPDLLLDRQDVQATFVQCTSCGLIYQNPRPTSEEIGLHYPATYDSYNRNRDPGHTSWLRKLVIQHGINKRRRFVTRVKQQGRLLDLGCATGQFLAEMSQNPEWELFGVEVNQHAARIAIDQYGLNVFNGTLEQAKFGDSFFDAITLWDVLEHLHDPDCSLKEIRRILKPNGILVIRVPNAGGWDAKIFAKYWFGWDAPRHLYVFSKHTLSRLLEANGFEVQSVQGGLGGYNSIILSLRFYLTAKYASSKLRNSIDKVLSHPLSRLLSAPLFYFLSIGSRGPFLIVTAAKRSCPTC